MSSEIPEKIQKIMDDYPDMNEAPLYSAKGLNVYIDLIKARYSSVDIQALLRHANMKMEEIKDPGHWFNQYQINAFMDYLIRQTGNPEIGREAGRFVCAPESLGILRSYYRAFGSPTKAFEKLTQLAADVSLSSDYQAIIHNNDKIEIIVKPYPRVTEEKFQCDNRKGYFEGIFQLFDLPLPKIEHDHCMFDDQNTHDYCRYFVSWEQVTSDKYKLIHNYLILISFLIIMITPFFIPFSTIIHLTCFLVITHLGFRLYIILHENQELRPIISNQSSINSTAYKELIEQIDENYHSLDMFRKISMGLSKPHQLSESLQGVLDVLKTRYDRCAILLANVEQSKLIYRAGFGYTQKQLQLWEKTGWFHVLDESRGTFIRTFRENRSFLINDIKEVINNFSLRSIEFANKMGVKSLISCPIYYHDQPLGVLAVDNYKNQRELIQSDINLLMGIAYQISIFIKYHRMATKEKQAAMVDMAQQAIHNIRNPASAIDVDLETLTKFCQLDSEANEILEDIKKENLRILELANNYLRYLNPIESRKETIKINSFIQDITKRLNDVQILLTIEPSNPLVNADPTDLKWIFEELIENTKKYGKFPIEITIQLHKNKDDEKQKHKRNQIIQIDFKDNGNNIPPDKKNEIFEPFFSLDKQNSGLGLATIKKKIEDHGGTISLSSNRNSGTCFIIQLPVL